MEAVGARRQIIAMDRPGWDGVSDPRDLAGNAQAATEWLDARRVERAVVVGHSFGGAVACWLAVFAPERISSLVLAAPSANLASLSRVDRWLAAPVAGTATTTALMMAGGLALTSARIRGALASHLPMSDSYLAAAGQSLRSAHARRSFLTEQRALIRELPRLERRLGRVTVPTAIVIGTGDRVVPVRSADQLSRQIAGAKLTVVPGDGHLLPLTQPELLAGLACAAPGEAA